MDEAVGLALPMGPERLMKNDEKQIGSLSLDGKVSSALPGESCIYAGSSEQIQGPLRTLPVYSLLLDGNTASFGQNEENRMKGKADPPPTYWDERNFTYSWPWDPGGCWEHSDVDVVHVDIVTMDKVPRIMTTNTSTPDLGSGISFPGYTRKEMRDKQNTDLHLKIILDWLEQGKTPGEGVIFFCYSSYKVSLDQ